MDSFRYQYRESNYSIGSSNNYMIDYSIDYDMIIILIDDESINRYRSISIDFNDRSFRSIIR